MDFQIDGADGAARTARRGAVREPFRSLLGARRSAHLVHK